MMIPDPTHEEILYVCQHLREASYREIFCATDLTAEQFAQHTHLCEGFKWVGYHGGLPAAILGASRLHGGVWTFYGFGTDDWDKIWRSVTVTAHRHLRRQMDEAGYHRAHCTTLTELTDIHRWLKFLGATEESVMRGYGKGGEDYSIFVWRKE